MILEKKIIHGQLFFKVFCQIVCIYIFTEAIFQFQWNNVLQGLSAYYRKVLCILKEQWVHVNFQIKEKNIQS